MEKEEIKKKQEISFCVDDIKVLAIEYFKKEESSNINAVLKFIIYLENQKYFDK